MKLKHYTLTDAVSARSRLPQRAEDVAAVMTTETPRVEALLAEVMTRHKGLGNLAQARYYEAAHQELAPLARELERETVMLRGLATFAQKTTAYYKAGMLKQEPPWVPATVRVSREQFGDPPFRGAGVDAGEHECKCNKWGAVSVTDRAGAVLGLRLDEFEPLTWRENVTAN